MKKKSARKHDGASTGYSGLAKRQVSKTPDVAERRMNRLKKENAIPRYLKPTTSSKHKVRKDHMTSTSLSSAQTGRMLELEGARKCSTFGKSSERNKANKFKSKPAEAPERNSRRRRRATVDTGVVERTKNIALGKASKKVENKSNQLQEILPEPIEQIENEIAKIQNELKVLEEREKLMKERQNYYYYKKFRTLRALSEPPEYVGFNSPSFSNGVLNTASTTSEPAWSFHSKEFEQSQDEGRFPSPYTYSQLADMNNDDHDITLYDNSTFIQQQLRRLEGKSFVNSMEDDIDVEVDAVETIETMNTPQMRKRDKNGDKNREDIKFKSKAKEGCERAKANKSDENSNSENASRTVAAGNGFKINSVKIRSRGRFVV